MKFELTNEQFDTVLGALTNAQKEAKKAVNRASNKGKGFSFIKIWVDEDSW
ncbi:MAG: hypothetical protein VW518_00355 [Burkholderiaceae bacterium]